MVGLGVAGAAADEMEATDANSAAVRKITQKIGLYMVVECPFVKACLFQSGGMPLSCKTSVKR